MIILVSTRFYLKSSCHSNGLNRKLLLYRDKRIKSASPSQSDSRIRKILNLIVETNMASGEHSAFEIGSKLTKLACLASMALLTLILFASIPVSQGMPSTFPSFDHSKYLEYKLFHLSVSYARSLFAHPMTLSKFLCYPKNVSF